MKASTENLSSKNTTNTISESVENRVGAMKQSSTHEFIKDLPELDDSAKPNHKDDDKTGNIIEVRIACHAYTIVIMVYLHCFLTSICMNIFFCILGFTSSRRATRRK